MTKYPKWKVNVAAQSFFTVDVEAESEQVAIHKALKEVQRNPTYYATADATVVTGVFINDREARDYHPFVPDSLPREVDTDILPKPNESV